MSSDSLHPRIPSSAGFLPADDVDPDLVQLPAPPKKERTLTVVLLALTALASLSMLVALRGDAAYSFAPHIATDLGDLRTAAIGPGDANHFVHAAGMLGAAGAIRYEHPFESDSYRVWPVAGRRDVWVESRVPAGHENARYVPPTSFSGRLVRFDASGPRHRGLGDSVRSVTGESVPDGAWLVIDGEEPDGARWAMALMFLFAGFALWNAVAIAKLVRRVG